MSSFDNFVQCQVIAPVAIGATELDLMPAVAPYKLPPVGGGLLVLVDSPGNPSFIEVIRYTARSGQQLTGLTRGQEGTVARAWSGTVFAFQSLMAGDFQSLLDSKLNAATYTAADVLTKIKTVDGAGSGLDADLLDGQEGSYYLSATNLNAGTLPDACLPERLRAAAANITDWNNATGNGWYMGSSAANAPTADATWYKGLVEVHNPSWVTQTVFAFSSDGAADTKTWRRELNNGTWVAWYRLRLSEAEQSALYNNASNLSSGIVPDARLSGTYTGVNITGNAATATKLATARTIGGVSFDGTASINLPGVNAGGNQSTTGNAATATALQTARTINGVSFDGTANITVADATKQAAHANLSALSGLAGAADRLPYFTGAGALSLATLTGLARTLLDDDTQSGMQSTLGLVKQTSATDTTAGALMAVGAFGLGITNNDQDPPGGATTNLDTIRTNGIYRITANSPNTPLGSSIGQMIHMGQGGGYAAQLAMKSQTTGINAPFYRVIDLDVAQPWTMLYTRATTLGTVSQSGGVPTGALMERGSNENGTYHRYADGTQITLRTIDYPAQALSTQGGITSVHSANFNGEYVVNITPETCIGNGNQSSIGALLYNGIYVAKFASYVSIDSYAYRVAVDVPVRLQVMCVGRWY